MEVKTAFGTPCMWFVGLHICQSDGQVQGCLCCKQPAVHVVLDGVNQASNRHTMHMLLVLEGTKTIKKNLFPN